MKSWNEIRKAATAFSKRGKNAFDEKGGMTGETSATGGEGTTGTIETGVPVVPKTIFDPDGTPHYVEHINGYLMPAPHIQTRLLPTSTTLSRCRRTW